MQLVTGINGSAEEPEFPSSNWKPFSLERGIRQGSVLSPVLCNYAIESLLADLKRIWASLYIHEVSALLPSYMPMVMISALEQSMLLMQLIKWI